MFAEVFVRQRLIVPGNAVTTANNITTSEQLFRFGFVADLICIIGTVFLSLFFFALFKPVNRNLSLLALLFSIIGCAVMAVNLLNQFAPIMLLQNSGYLEVFSIEQIQALALFFLKLQSQGYNITLFIFAFYFPVIGYLIYNSKILPPALGILYALAGLGYFVNSLAWFLLPHLAIQLFPYVLLPAFIGELAMTIWLISKGIDENKLTNYLVQLNNAETS